MPDFKVVRMSGKDNDLPKFEAEIKNLLNQGWKLVNCSLDGIRIFAFLQK